MTVVPVESSAAVPLYLDVSTLVRWVGPPVGIVRVEAELARYVLERRPDVGFIVYDSRLDHFRRIARHMIPRLVTGELLVDETGVPDPRSIKRNWLGGLLNRLDRQLLYFRRPRRAFIRTLENLRTKLPSSWRWPVEYLQARAFDDRYRRMYIDPDGRRRTPVEFAALLEDGPLALEGATILSAGFEWNTKNPERLRRLKERERFRLVMVCYDMIPIIFPQFYLQRDRDVFFNYMRSAISFVDKFICISNCTARDLAKFALEQDQPLREEVSVQYLGSDLPRSEDAALPDTLTPRRYALYVSTIEPRKNHELLDRVWQRLLDDGIPQRHSFQLVFVGRPGWGIGDLIQKFTNDTHAGRRFRYLPNVKDSVLVRLYRDAAFCLYPSRYEGFGLPVIEAFSYGRAVIASNGGSIAEAVQEFCPCLDPDDEDAWYETLRQWIEDPKVVASYEAKISNGFRHRPWSDAAERYLAESEIQRVLAVVP